MSKKRNNLKIAALDGFMLYVTTCLSIVQEYVSYRVCFFFNSRWEAAIELCKSILKLNPVDCQLLETLVGLYLQTEQIERACDVWLTAFEKNPQNAQVFYFMCKFFILQVKCQLI